MKTKSLLAAIAAFASLLVTRADANEADLAKRVTQQDGWVAWQVAMTAHGDVPCCDSWRAGNAVRGGCDLDGRSWSVSARDHDSAGAADRLAIFLHVAHAGIDKARAFAASCPVQDADRVRWLDGVDARDSIAWLAGTAPNAHEEVADAELAAIALHAEPVATSALERLSLPGNARHLREQSLFWLGQERGADGAHIIEHAATSDGDTELRANAVFALSQSHSIDAYVAIHRIAQTDASEQVRGQALFWMAQMDDARAQGDICAAIGADPSASVREQAVFALSQLKGDRADAALIAIVRGPYSHKVKEQALFWLGQSGSPRALDFIDAVLSKPAVKPMSG